jgi:hypothetical protein
MKSKWKKLMIGALFIFMILASSTGLAEDVQKTIEVYFNKVNLEVNNQPVVTQNILYNGTTYVPLREVAEILSKEVGWENSTKTASINNKKDDNDLSNENSSKWEILNGNWKESDGELINSDSGEIHVSLTGLSDRIVSVDATMEKEVGNIGIIIKYDKESGDTVQGWLGRYGILQLGKNINGNFELLGQAVIEGINPGDTFTLTGSVVGNTYKLYLNGKQHITVIVPDAPNTGVSGVFNTTPQATFSNFKIELDSFALKDN